MIYQNRAPKQNLTRDLNPSAVAAGVWVQGHLTHAKLLEMPIFGN